MLWGLLDRAETAILPTDLVSMQEEGMGGSTSSLVLATLSLRWQWGIKAEISGKFSEMNDLIVGEHYGVK